MRLRQLLLLLPPFLWAAINLWELSEIYVFHQTAGYPFGNEGPAPSYYASQQTYTNHCLWQIGWSILAMIAIVYLLKRYTNPKIK